MFRKRIPIEIAPPGTDPTEQYHPLPRRRKGDLRSTLPWIVGLALFLLAGYRTYINPGDGQTEAQKARPALFVSGKESKNAAQPTPTTAPPAAPSAGRESKEIVTPSPTPIPTLPPTPTLEPPTSTPIPANIVTFGVFDDGEQIACTCNLDTGEVGGADLELCRAYPPSTCRKGE